jgi:hypothetical protein
VSTIAFFHYSPAAAVARTSEQKRKNSGEFSHFSDTNEQHNVLQLLLNSLQSIYLFNNNGHCLRVSESFDSSSIVV